MANSPGCPSCDLDVDDVEAIWLGARRLVIRGLIGQSVGYPPKILRVPASLLFFFFNSFRAQFIVGKLALLPGYPLLRVQEHDSQCAVAGADEDF